jgi:hypothetical protein
MSTGFNVETYQLNKQENGGAGPGSTYDILARLETLENNQMNVFNQFTCDFKDDEYTNTYLSDVVFNSQGIVARQYQSLWHDNLVYDDIVDWDKSKFIAFTNQSIKLDTPSTAYGEFYTLPITLSSNYVGFKFSADTRIPIVETLIGRQLLKAGHLWFAKGLDNYGRLWLFRADTYKYENSQVFLTIYNTDMTIYKEATIPGLSFFGPVTAAGSYGYAAMHNSACIRFSEENLCIISFMMVNCTRDGMFYDTYTIQDGNANSSTKNIVTFVDENGNAAVKYNYNQGINYNWLHWYSDNGYHACNMPFEPVRMIIHKNKIILITGPTSRLFGYQNYNQNRMGRVIISPVNGRLNDVNGAVTYGDGYSNYYELSNANYNTWCSRFTTELFNIGEKCYFFVTDWGRYDTVNGIGKIWLAELDINDAYNVSAFTTDYAYKLQGTMTYPPYGFGGANGMYYSKKYNYLYIFSNATNSPLLNITRFEIDWTSKNSTALTINLINPIIKTVTLPNTTYNASFNAYYTQKLKVHEDDKLLNLVFGTNSAVTTKREIDYMSMDFDLNIVQPQAQVHISDGTLIDTVTTFGMVINGDKKFILYGRGNRDDFVDSTATVNSGIYTDVVQQVSSSIDFFYATDKELTWKPINSGDTKTLAVPANDIRIRAVLKSSAVYDSSPVINALSVESWDNNNVASRQSSYYSNQLSVLQNEGKAVLYADQDVGDGQIDWYISFNGGLNWTLTQLNTEFVYNYASTPDFRVKAVLSVKDNSLHPPIVRSYTLKTSHMVLHSDLEEIQINLMKTNFKIDTYTKASKNGLLKMTIDTFSNDTAVDTANSDYNYYATNGTVGGNYIVTKPEVINDTVLTILLTTDEILDSSKANSHIEYEVSIDGGITYKQINPNIKLQLNNTSSSSSTLILKAVFYDNAQLNAWGWAWD